MLSIVAYFVWLREKELVHYFNPLIGPNGQFEFKGVFYRIFKYALFREIFWLKISSCSPFWIFVDMHDTSKVGSRNFIFLRNNGQNAPKTTYTVSASDFNTNWKDFKEYLIVGWYLGAPLNGLSLLWRHQNIANEIKN